MTMSFPMNRWKFKEIPILVVGLLAGICFWAVPASGSENVEELTKACFLGNVEKVTQLLSDGVDVNGRDKSGSTPLTNAVGMNKGSIAELLLSRGADPNLKDGLGDPPLVIAAKTWKNVATIKLLMEKGADPNLAGQLDDTPLIVAARWGNAELVTLFLSHGADVNKTGNLESTPLIVACTTGTAGRVPTVKALIDGGADVTVKTRFGVTALEAAKRNKNEELVKFLMERGVKELTKT
jgi:uncharacterized protein